MTEREKGKNTTPSAKWENNPLVAAKIANHLTKWLHEVPVFYHVVFNSKENIFL